MMARLGVKALCCHPPTVGHGMRHDGETGDLVKQHVVLLTFCLWAIGLFRLYWEKTMDPVLTLY